MDKSYREDIFKFAAKNYGTEPEYLWARYPGSAVLRHGESKKWYAIIMDVSRDKLGLPGEGIVDILNIKCDPVFGASLRLEPGFLPAYHMNRGHWITIVLDGTVELDMITSLLDVSFSLVGSSDKRKKTGESRNREWLIPANPKYYDVVKAFTEKEIILWKQSSKVAVGDMVYMYVAAPCSAILYACRAVEVDIPHKSKNPNVRMNRAMRIKRLHSFDKSQFPLETLKEHGVFAVRGPRSVPASLSQELKMACGRE